MINCNPSKIAIIGSGFSGISAAAYLSAAGHDVHVFEKNEEPGGRARQFKTPCGYLFDMGPSWYWMPDVFERFFASFGKKPPDYYSLKRLDPSYRVYWQHDTADIPADYKELHQLFETIEPGSGHQLDLFLKEAAYKYQ